MVYVLRKIYEKSKTVSKRVLEDLNIILFGGISLNFDEVFNEGSLFGFMEIPIVRLVRM